jgi:hypothetical protein
MKRTLLGLIMLSSLALMAAPKANALGIVECGKSYAFQVHGTEPSTINDAALLYVYGVGQISFAAVGSNGPTGCLVNHLEMIYNDDDIFGFYAGPTGCYVANSLGGGIACFDGGDHQSAVGLLGPSSDGNGAATLTIAPSFTWVDGGFVAPVSLPLQFTLQANVGGLTVLGNSVAPPGPSLPPGSPPANPVLSITMQKQSSTAVLPVTGPAPDCGDFGCTGGGNNGYGVAPYLGLSVFSAEGFVGTSINPLAFPITGAFGSAVGALQVFSSGQAGGSESFNSNDNVGNAPPFKDDCDLNVTQTGNFGDGTNNNSIQIVHPSSKCDNSVLSFNETSGVQWGPVDTSSYSIITGVGGPATGELVFFPGQMVTGTALPSAPAGRLSSTATVSIILRSNNISIQRILYLTNTSPAGCDVNFNMVSSSDGTCSTSLAGGNPTSVLKEGGTALAPAATINCTCTAADLTGTTTSLTVTSSNCQVASGAGPVSVTCHD